ncbi:MAG: hypothetical protein ACPG4T_20130 [Nannocystaceae bacterium]
MTLVTEPTAKPNGSLGFAPGDLRVAMVSAMLDRAISLATGRFAVPVVAAGCTLKHNV